MNQIFRQKSYHNRLSSLIFVRFSQIFVLKLKSVIVLKGNGARVAVDINQRMGRFCRFLPHSLLCNRKKQYLCIVVVTTTTLFIRLVVLRIMRRELR